MSPSQCLEQLPAVLSSTEPNSHLFFRYELYRLDALLNLGRFEQLQQALSPWLDNTTVPMRFRLAVLTYQAKVFHVAKKPQLASRWLNKALTLMQQFSEHSSSPMAMIEIANLQLYLNDIEAAYQTLRTIEQKHLRHASPRFKQELYANLAQALRKQGDLTQHLDYRQRSLRAAEAVSNLQQIGVSWHNVARAHQILEQFNHAESAFIKAADFAKRAGDEATLMQCLLYRAEIAHHNQQLKKAEQLLSLIDERPLTPSRRAVLRQLSQALGLTRESGAFDARDPDTI
ncbi:hypothetical protein [Lacimicrobium sp. SS2-24]|uniref:hypothetical protein n=1 Tax=Lacimicrobium sp. SS2-24 TaxID=2005569 RepID=UPI000B4AD179|nr:hypothetical protein [Lacimicrobium sp. SS2-24]